LERFHGFSYSKIERTAGRDAVMRAVHAARRNAPPSATMLPATNVPRESDAPPAGDEQNVLTGRFAPDGERGAFFAHHM
jgi:hypothetical protein